MPSTLSYVQSGPRWVKANKFFQKIVDVKVASASKNFEKAAEEFQGAMAAFEEW